MSLESQAINHLVLDDICNKIKGIPSKESLSPIKSSVGILNEFSSGLHRGYILIQLGPLCVNLNKVQGWYVVRKGLNLSSTFVESISIKVFICGSLGCKEKIKVNRICTFYYMSAQKRVFLKLSGLVVCIYWVFFYFAIPSKLLLNVCGNVRIFSDLYLALGKWHRY